MARQAFDNISGDFFNLSEEMIKDGLHASRECARKRIILPVHREQEAEVQRMINFLQPGTYIRPHKHPLSHATESIIVLKGRIRFFIFDEKGKILNETEVGCKPIPAVLDIEPQVWHSFLVLEVDTILFECKKGPYDAKTDKIFASWAPEERSKEAEDWIESL